MAELTTITIRTYPNDPNSASTTTVTTPESLVATLLPLEATSSSLTSSTTSTSSTTTSTSTTTTSTSTTTTSTSTTTTSSSAGPTSSNATVVNAGSPNLGPGPVAGVAIACVVVGLALGALAAFFFLRRRQRTRGPDYGAVPAPAYDDKLGAAPASPGVLAVADPVPLDSFLLVSKPDSEIAGALRHIGEAVTLHVENNYQRGPVQAEPHALTQHLAGLGFPHEAAVTITQLAAEPATRLAALQHVISAAVLGSVIVSAATPVSMLPASVAAFTKEMPPVEQLHGSPEAVTLAFTRWRQLTAFLLSPNRSSRTPLAPTDTGILVQAQALVRELNGFLGFFAKPDGTEQAAHLQAVVMECTRFGYMLFSQPAEFKFNFNAGQTVGLIVVCPGLDKVADEQGNPISPPQVLVPPSVAQIA